MENKKTYNEKVRDELFDPSTKNANRNAFPVSMDTPANGQYDGLTKRELFVKDIFCALISGRPNPNSDDCKKIAFTMADKLLAGFSE